MKRPKHKLIFGSNAPCGVDYADLPNSGDPRLAEKAYHWKNVTCLRCLKTRGKK